MRQQPRALHRVHRHLRIEELEARVAPAGLFELVGGFKAGGSPLFVTVADLNGDGAADLAVADSSADKAGAMLGNGDGTFAPAGTFASRGSWPHSIAVADFNGDGIPDLAVANYDSHSVTVFSGNGDGTFARVSTVNTVGGGPASVVTGDFNGDGISDLAVANAASSNVAVLLGNGNGTFSTAGTYNSGGRAPEAMVVGDFNGDGHSDLAVVNYYSKNVGVLYGVGDSSGSFVGAATFGSGGTGPLWLAVGDFNGDGFSDLGVANNGSRNVGVLLGSGDGTFAGATTFGSGGTGPYSVVVADFNGDGQDDLAVANKDSNTVGTLLGNGDGSFATVETYAPGGKAPWSLAVGDLNGDGRPDLAVANAGSKSVSVLLNSYEPWPTEPRVSVAATQPMADEIGPVPGVFTVTRAGSTTEALVVPYTLGGTAINGVDYANLSGSVTFGVGSSSANITIVPLADGDDVDFKTVLLTLSASGNYIVGPSHSARVIINETDGPLPMLVPLSPGVKSGFTDGNGTGVTLLLAGTTSSTSYYSVTYDDVNGLRLDSIVMTETYSRTTLTITCTGTAGTTAGTTMAGVDIVEAATAGAVAFGKLSTGEVALRDGGQVTADGGVSTLTIGDVGANAEILIGGSLGTFTGGTRGAGTVIGAGGNINTLRIVSGGLAAITAGGAIGTITVSGSTAGGDLSGNILAQGAGGIGTITVSNGNLAGTTLSAPNAALPGKGITAVRVNGSANNVVVTTSGKVSAFSLTGRGTQGYSLSGLFDVQTLGSLTGAKVDVNNLKVRATSGIVTVNVRSITNSIFSAGSMGSVTTSQNVTGSALLAGYDIGPDYTIGPGHGAFAGATGSINSITVGGTMSASSIAANIDPGPDNMFGTADDLLLSASLEGAIKALTVRKELNGLAGSTAGYGVVAHQFIDRVAINGAPVTTFPYHGTVGNIIVQPYWR